MQNGCPAGSANTYRGSSWSSVRSSSSVAPRASALSRWICKSSRVATTVSRWSICGTAASGHVDGRTLRSAGTPAVVRRACSATRASHYPAGQAGWAPAAHRRRGTPARTAGGRTRLRPRIGGVEHHLSNPWVRLSHFLMLSSRSDRTSNHVGLELSLRACLADAMLADCSVDGSPGSGTYGGRMPAIANRGTAGRLNLIGPPTPPAQSPCAQARVRAKVRAHGRGLHAGWHRADRPASRGQ